MTAESSPGQGAPQEDGWAFRPRTPATGPQPYREQWPTEPTGAWDDRSWDEPYGGPSGARWDSTVPLRTPEPRTGAHEAVRERGHRTPPHTLWTGEPADQDHYRYQDQDQHQHQHQHQHHGHPSTATAVLDQAALRRPEPAPARPGPPAGAAGERAGRTRRVGRIALVLAVLAAVGGAAAVLLKQEEAAAVASEQLTQAWQVPAPADDTLIGSWLTDKLLVRAGTRGGLRAYDLTDGKQVWSAASGAAASERGNVPCAMSPKVGARGIGTVAFGKDGSTCTWLAGVKASTGKILWSVPLTDTKHPKAATATTYLQGDVATVVGQNFLGGVDIRTGDRVWGYKARGHYCNAHGRGAEGAVLVDDFCLDRKTRFTLTAYDGRTGKVIWRKSESAHADVTHFLSGSPLIAAVHTVHQDAVRVFGTTGTGRRLAVGNDELTTGNDTGADHSARLYGHVLVTPASAAGHPVIDGFDTTTGAKLWIHRSAALAVPASGSDDKVYAVTTSGTPQLVTIDPRTGRTTPVAVLPTGTGKGHFTSGTVYATPDGGVLEIDALGSDGGVRLYR
ncbi:outer membrane protein assembly factor BamB family protein [Streptomyces triticiradicis]|uniref:PQQ-binding-like beta-propeller repeat protein n=1 Tax=Streptomyces triticiradicis TaxID=2651189 RepID=A0A7J5DFQ8_9ACTN|nr:PQQ-binding-like beta-propeller repeat protein [Streptomyces triticiradicis]KAB1987719.1 PQQ-binding-like beta-propeller repeat protein [Streptomyces triticiradicis]